MEGEALIRTLIRRLLVHGICNFEDGIKTAVRELVERTFNGHLFKAYLLTVCAYSKTKHEPQGGEKSERRSSTISNVRLCRLGAKLAHKGRWHGFQPICIANSSSAVRCSQRTSDCYEVNRVSVVPRYAVAVGSLKLVQWGNGDMGATR